MSSVFGAVGVGMADQRGLPVIVEECVGDRDIVSRVGKLYLTSEKLA